MTIFVLEDDPSMCEILRIIFEGSGFKFICAGSIPTALSILESLIPDYALIDLLIGSELSSSVIDKLLNNNRTKVILISALGRQGNEIASQYKVDLLRKPFELEELEKRFDRPLLMYY